MWTKVLGFTQNGGGESEKNESETRIRRETKELTDIKERAKSGM